MPEDAATSRVSGYSFDSPARRSPVRPTPALTLRPEERDGLQEREFERLGSGRTLRTDARPIAATSRELGALAEEQKFRADLFYRLNVFRIHVPSLRARSFFPPGRFCAFLSTIGTSIPSPARTREKATGCQPVGSRQPTGAEGLARPTWPDESAPHFARPAGTCERPSDGDVGHRICGASSGQSVC